MIRFEKLVTMIAALAVLTAIPGTGTYALAAQAFGSGSSRRSAGNHPNWRRSPGGVQKRGSRLADPRATPKKVRRASSAMEEPVELTAEEGLPTELPPALIPVDLEPGVMASDPAGTEDAKQAQDMERVAQGMVQFDGADKNLRPSEELPVLLQGIRVEIARGVEQLRRDIEAISLRSGSLSGDKDAAGRVSARIQIENRGESGIVLQDSPLLDEPAVKGKLLAAIKAGIRVSVADPSHPHRTIEFGRSANNPGLIYAMHWEESRPRFFNAEGPGSLRLAPQGTPVTAENLPGIYAARLAIPGPYLLIELRVDKGGTYGFRVANMDKGPGPVFEGSWELQEGSFSGTHRIPGVGQVSVRIKLAGTSLEALKSDDGVQLTVEIKQGANIVAQPFRVRKTDSPVFSVEQKDLQ